MAVCILLLFFLTLVKTRVRKKLEIENAGKTTEYYYYYYYYYYYVETVNLLTRS